MRGKRNPNANIPLGLAVIEGMIYEGKLQAPVNLEVIAAACGVTWQAIYHTEHKALHKLRAAFYRQDVKRLSDLMQ